jgi:FdhE protein
MAERTFNERVKQIDEVISKHPELTRVLNLYKDLFKAKMEMEEDRNKGLSLGLSEELINSIRERAWRERKPMTYFIDEISFSTEKIIKTISLAVDVLHKHGLNNKLKNIDVILRNNDLIDKLIKAALRNDVDVYIDISNNLGIDSASLSLIFSIVVQPLLENLSRSIDKALLEKWFNTLCPICGRKSNIAKIRNKKKYLVCPLCGAEYRIEYLLCINCGNRDPYTLYFLIDERNPAYKIDVCMKCRCYVKVIDEDLLQENIPKGLEDILTWELDKIAEYKGLARIST